MSDNPNVIHDPLSRRALPAPIQGEAGGLRRGVTRMRRVLNRVLLVAAALAVPTMTLAAGKVAEAVCACCEHCPPCCL